MSEIHITDSTDPPQACPGAPRSAAAFGGAPVVACGHGQRLRMGGVGKLAQPRVSPGDGHAGF